MTVVVTPAPLCGEIPAISSKSDAHRHLICAALADRPTRLHCPDTSEDIDATMRCLRQLGARIEREGGDITVSPPPSGHTIGKASLDCGESGSTLRFLLPVAAALCGEAHFTGRGRLPQRPLGDLAAALGSNGAVCSSDHLPLSVGGQLKSGLFRLPGNVSSQYISGLLFALPLLAGDSEIRLSTALESAAYVDITLHVLGQYGIAVHRREWGFLVPGGQRYRSPGEAAVDGDWSNAAFFLAAGAIGRPVTVSGLKESSPQGDRRIVDLLRQFGANVLVEGDRITVSPGALSGQEIDIAETPDLLPVLAVVAACAHGETRFFNGARLRLKESDRLSTTARMIRALGGWAQEDGDELLVRSCGLRGGEADSFQDHRIAMAAAVAAIACAEPVTIARAEAVAKSYPGFFDDYRRLGGLCNGMESASNR